MAAARVSCFALMPLRTPRRSTCSSCLFSTSSSTSALSNNNFAQIAAGGQAELLLARSSLESYFHPAITKQEECLLTLANTCRRQFLETGMAHVPKFIAPTICHQMVHEASMLKKEAFYSTEDHTVYQESTDEQFAESHPRNDLQKSSKWIIDYDRIMQSSPLVDLYTSPHVHAFVAYVVRPETSSTSSIAVEADFALYESGCPYNAAYYNIYESGDGLGWHFDRSIFGVNLELQPALEGGNFELCWNTRSSSCSNNDKDKDDVDIWAFDKVQRILKESSDSECSLAQRIDNPPVGPGSLVLFAGARNLHRVTHVQSPQPRINAIMTYETQPHQKPNAYSLAKFFGR